jgi:LPS export ABC transporter protein LptC
MSSFLKLLSVSALALSIAGLASCENKIEEIRELTNRTTSVERGIKIESFLSQAGIMKARLTAPLMNRYQADSPYIEFPNRLHVDFYNDSIKVESELFAKYGRYKENERKVFLRDSIVIFNSKGDTIYCQELWWDQQQEKFYSDKPVIVKQPGRTLYGDQGMRASQNFNEWTLLKARGPVQLPVDAELP